MSRTPPAGPLGAGSASASFASSFSLGLDSPPTLNGNHDFLGSYFRSDRSAPGSPALSQAPGQGQAQAQAQAQAQTVAQQPRAASMNQNAGRPARDKARLRPQYPQDPSKQHVEFVLVASFDIDRGSIMEHQYPMPISGDEHMLAELMLPDQAHNRSQDWTIFFLHKDPVEDDDEEDPAARRRKRRRKRKLEAQAAAGATENAENLKEQADDGESSEGEISDDDEYDEALQGQPLIYVLNLVNTKHDSSVKRGAIVKAMAIGTRHPFLHIYKPLLLLALDEYLKATDVDGQIKTLDSLFNAVNSMDLSLLPRLSLLERNILQASTAKDIFVEKFQWMIEQRKSEERGQGYESPRKAGGDGNLTPTPRYALPRDTHEFESRILYNGISVPVKIPTARSPETVGDFSIIKLIQTFSGPHTQSPQPFALHAHLTTGGAYTHPIIVLVNALLTQKRIIFLGHNRPSGEVAEAVLAACALASGGLLRGFTRHAFPYTDLTKIDQLLDVPGFIAGVTNPAFANKPEWWDLLCDLPTGRMKISNRMDPPQITEGITSFQQQNPSALTPANIQTLQANDATGDARFMDDVLKSIENRRGEGAIRSLWRDWIVKLIRIAAAFEEAVYGASALFIGGEEADAGAFGVRGHGYVWSDDATRQKEMAANVNRIEGWRNTRSYYSLIQDMATLYTSRPISSVDLHHHHDRLRTQKLSVDEAAAIFLAFEKAVQTDEEICQLLTVTPESHGGLFYLSLGLSHPRRDVRYKAVELLERIKRHEAGGHFWEGVGRFAKLAFFRLKREADSGRAADEHDDGMSRATTLMEQTSVASG